MPETTLGDLLIVATLLTFAFGLKVVDASVGDLGCFEGDGGRGELVRDGGLEDVEGALGRSIGGRGRIWLELRQTWPSGVKYHPLRVVGIMAS